MSDLSKHYKGEVMHQCLLKPFDFKYTYAVVVSGDLPNPCGHMLLSAGHFYFHVAGAIDPPRYMLADSFSRYLKENEKIEIRRTYVKIPNPAGAHQKLEELLATWWAWGMLPHNCANFCEQVVQAGGSKAGLYFNCPVAERFT
jgi:hypothetical protein